MPAARLSAQLGSVPSAMSLGLPPENGTVAMMLRGPPQSAAGLAPEISSDRPSGEIPYGAKLGGNRWTTVRVARLTLTGQTTPQAALSAARRVPSFETATGQAWSFITVDERPPVNRSR